MRCRTVLVIAALSLLLAACGPSEQPGTAVPASSDEAATPDGKALVEARCTICHNIGRIDEATHDRAGWEETVDRMIKTGARLTDAERKAVIDYLVSQ
jgi:cytochrome c5